VTTGRRGDRGDLLDVGRERVPLRDRWGALGGPGRAAAGAVAVALALGAAVVVGQRDAADQQRRDEAGARAAAEARVELDARLIATRTRVAGGGLGFRLRVHNAGPLPVVVTDARVGVDRLAALATTTEPVEVPAGEAVLVEARYGDPVCPVAERPPALPPGELVALLVRTADGAVRPVVVADGGPLPRVVARAAGCR